MKKLSDLAVLLIFGGFFGCCYVAIMIFFVGLTFLIKLFL